MSESVDVRLARIEEKMGANHIIVMESLKPLVPKVNKHHEWLIAIRRDRWWLGVLCVYALHQLGKSIVKFIQGA